MTKERRTGLYPVGSGVKTVFSPPGLQSSPIRLTHRKRGSVKVWVQTVLGIRWIRVAVLFTSLSVVFKIARFGVLVLLLLLLVFCILLLLVLVVFFIRVLLFVLGIRTVVLSTMMLL